MFYLFISRLWWPQQPIYITLEGLSFFTFGGGLSLGAALGLISLFAPISECTSSEALKVVEKIGVCLDRLPRQTPSSSILTKH